MAEARSAVSPPHVTDFEEGIDPKKDFLVAWRKSLFRRYFRTRNLIRNGMWPTSMWNLGVTVSIFSVLLLGDWSWAQPINTRLYYIGTLFRIHEGWPFMLRVLTISFLSGVVFFILLMYKRRFLLRILLSYRGWMYENPKSQSIKTMLWGLLVRLVSGYSPTTYSCQKSLPFLPLPPLKSTVNNFMESVRPLYPEGSESYEKLKEEAKVFESGLGLKLQRILRLKTWWAQNWVTDWWEKYVYLMSRDPIAINSNYYVLDHGYWKPTHRQISRAASTIYQMLSVKRRLEREQLTPLLIRNTIPLCMAQYERVFATNRVPMEPIDKLVTWNNIKHISVLRCGVYYQLDIVDSDNNLLTPQSLEKQLGWIIEDADKHKDSYCSGAKSVAALTGIGRSEWAETREKYFTSGVNKDTVTVIESSAFHVILDTNAFDSWSDRGKYLLHADGKTLWFDKSFSLMFFTDGKQGMNAEHSWGDAPVMAHCNEFNLTKEVIQGMYDNDGYCLPDKEVTYTQGALTQPTRLLWEIPEELEEKIHRAIDFNQKNNVDLDLRVVDHNVYGKGFIKTCKVSPDAFIQLALQLAYYKDSGKFALTYEASMTRLYLLGRTETVRSLTNQAADFVKAMCDKRSSPSECIALLNTACEVHQKLYRDAMNGGGVDRHLFGLYVVSKGLGYESDFLKDALTMPWTLSTSQQPQQQIAESPNCNLPMYKNKVCPGGGFGPVSDKGYGVSYMVPGDDRIFFHVSSKRSCETTDSERFTHKLFDAMAEMRALFTGIMRPEATTATQQNGTAEANKNGEKKDK